MKVGLVVPYLSGHGGMETVLKSFVDHYDDSTLSVCFPQGVQSTDFLTDILKQRLTVRKVPNKKLVRQTVGVFNLSKYILKTDADVIICMSSMLIKLVAKLRSLFKKQFAIVSWLHFSITDEDALNYNDLKLADFHFAISSGIKKQMVANKISANKIFTIYNPISTMNNHVIEKSHDGVTRFAYIGRMMWERQKNLKEMLTSFKDVKGNYIFGKC